MKVFTIDPDDSYAGVVPIEPDHAVRVVGTGGLTGESMTDRWELLRFRLQAPQRRRGDFFAFTTTFGFSERVPETFVDLFEKVGEVLPIEIDGVPHCVLNVLRRVDALDMEHSKYTKYSYVDKIASIERHAFFPARVQSETIFFVQQRLSVMYTTGDHPDTNKDFHKRVESLGYKGMKFKPVWSSG